MFRQSVISIFKAVSEGNYKKTPDLNIVFRQPFNSFGLAYTFSFNKSFFAPITDCKIVIFNADSKIVEALQFEYSKPRTRPKIEIYAGYSDTKILNNSNVEINRLKSSINQVYTGFPIFFSDDKLVGERELSIDCTDISLVGSSERVSASFKENTLVTTILEELLSDLEVDLSLLKSNTTFANLKIEHEVFYNNRLLLEDVIPDLERQYGFTHLTNYDGQLVFQNKSEKGQPGNSLQNVISPQNGMIEFPNTINWVDYECRTFFGRPDIFYPGERVTLKASNLTTDVRGLIVNGEYNFNDREAEIRYIINQYGQPFNAYPILRI